MVVIVRGEKNEKGKGRFLGGGGGGKALLVVKVKQLS